MGTGQGRQPSGLATSTLAHNAVTVVSCWHTSRHIEKGKAHQKPFYEKR